MLLKVGAQLVMVILLACVALIRIMSKRQLISRCCSENVPLHADSQSCRGLSEPSFMRRWARHLTSVGFSSEQSGINLSRAVLDNLCALTRLRTLQLLTSPEEASEPLTAAISQLTALETLVVSSYGPHAIPNEVSHLQRLTQVVVSGCGDSSALLCDLPCLQRLQIGSIAQPLIVPASLTGLSQLTDLRLWSVHVAGSIQALSQLFGLKALRLRYVGSTDDQQSRGLLRALGKLVGLQDLRLQSNSFPVELTGFSALSNLETLKIEEHNLQDGVCSARWRRLRCLILSGNSLTAFPRGWTSLPCLEEISIRYQSSPEDLDVEGLLVCV